MLKYRYADEFRHARDLGLHIWLSCPSYCAEFFGDLKEIGVDVIRIESPYMSDIASIGRQYRGRLAFAVCLDEIANDGGMDLNQFCQIRDCLSSNGNGFIPQFTEATPAKAIDKIVANVRKKIG